MSYVDLLWPYDAEKMTAWKMNRAVGKVKNDSPELIETAPEQVDVAAPQLQHRSSAARKASRMVMNSSDRFQVAGKNDRVARQYAILSQLERQGAGR
jgi:hypothetical protein